MGVGLALLYMETNDRNEDTERKATGDRNGTARHWASMRRICDAFFVEGGGVESIGSSRAKDRAAKISVYLYEDYPGLETLRKDILDIEPDATINLVKGSRKAYSGGGKEWIIAP